MKRMIGAALIAMAMLNHTPALAQQPGNAPRGHAMNMLNHQPLTLEMAKNAVDALILLREKYRDTRFKGRVDGPGGVIAALKNSGVRADIEADLKRFGFASIDDWVGKFVSLGLAVSYVRRNRDGEIEKKVAEIRANDKMPESIREQLIGMLTALVPPKGNAEVARRLLADAAYAEKIDKLMPRRDDSGGIRQMDR
ncbi:MAG TPA: hypothetical protein ENK13_03815 [Thermopetrobacter sp.]|nr:hypothetical protein [Thermopetrobacter sp.]